jgi:hypothetical protein
MLRGLGLSTSLLPTSIRIATQRDHYAEHFGSQRLETCRSHEPTIDTLLKLMGA